MAAIISHSELVASVDTIGLLRQSGEQGRFGALEQNFEQAKMLDENTWKNQSVYAMGGAAAPERMAAVGDRF